MKPISKIALACSLVFLLSAASSALAASFSADMVKEEDGKIETCKFFMLGDKYRMEVEEDGMKGTILVDRTGGKTRLLIHDKKEYKEMNNNDFFVLISNPFEAYEMMLGKFESRSGGSEKIDGIECEKVILSSEGKDVVTAWVAKPYAFLIRLENHENGNTYAMKNIKEEPMEEADFQIPAGYSKMEDPREKRAREEAVLPLLTTTATGTTPWGRRIGPSGEMRVTVNPEESVRIKFENFTEDESVFFIKGFRAGQPIDLDSQYTTFSLKGKGRRNECLVGVQNQAEEISVIVEKGKILAEVFNEQSSFSDEDKTTSFFILTGIRDRGQGKHVDPKRQIRLSITNASQDSTESNIKVSFYRDQDEKDKVDETDVVLKNGQSKTWDYPAEMGIQYLNIDVAKGGGVQVILEQPAPVEKAVKKTPQPKITEEFTVTHPKGTGRLLSPGKDLAIIVTGVSPDASGAIRLYNDRNQTKKIDTFSFRLNKDETESMFVYGSRQVGFAYVEVHRGSFKVKLDQSPDARAEVTKYKKKPRSAVPAPAPPKAETAAAAPPASGTIFNGAVPLMDGATVLKEMMMGSSGRVDLEVPASPEEVVNFYKQVMTEKGWQPGMTMVQGPMGVIQLMKGTSQITLKAQGDGQKSTVNIAVITR